MPHCEKLPAAAENSAVALVHPVATHTLWELQQQEGKDPTLQILLQAEDNTVCLEDTHLDIYL